MKKYTTKPEQDNKLNSKVGRTFTYREFVELISKSSPIRIKALI